MSNVAWKTTRMAISLSSLFDRWLILIAKRCSALLSNLLLRGISVCLNCYNRCSSVYFRVRGKLLRWMNQIRRCLATFSNCNKPFTWFQERTPPQNKVCSWRPSLGAIQDKQYLFFNVMVISTLGGLFWVDKMSIWFCRDKVERLNSVP